MIRLPSRADSAILLRRVSMAHISGGSTNSIPNATNSSLILNNLPTDQYGLAYELEAINATNSLGVSYSSPSSLVVSTLPARRQWHHCCRRRPKVVWDPMAPAPIRLYPTVWVGTDQQPDCQREYRRWQPRFGRRQFWPGQCQWRSDHIDRWRNWVHQLLAECGQQPHHGHLRCGSGGYSVTYTLPNNYDLYQRL